MTDPAGQPEPLALRVRGHLRTTALAIEEALRARTGEPILGLDRDGEGTLLLDAHLAAAPFEIRIDGSAVSFVAETATAGPGLHAFAVELVRGLGSHVDWDLGGAEDPSGYVRSGSTEALLAHASRWLSALAADALEMVDAGARGIAMLLPADVAFDHPAPVLTPLGPRDRAWLAAVAEDGRRGADALPWWEPGTGARYHRDLALAFLWTEIRPRRPIDDEERAQIDRVLSLLEIAHGLDPELELPWRAFGELFERRGEESLRATRAQLRAEKTPPGPPIGYRHGTVRVDLPAGWSIRVPGALRTRFAEHGTFVAWDAEHTYWVTTITAGEAQATEATLADLKEPDGDGPILALEKGALRGRGRFGIADDGWQVLRAQAAIGRHAALGTLLFAREAERDAVLETWGTLDHPDASSS